MEQGDGDGGTEFFENTLFMYLAMLGLSCGIKDLVPWSVQFSHSVVSDSL